MDQSSKVKQYLAGDSTGSLGLDGLSISEEEEDEPCDSLPISEDPGTVMAMDAPPTQYCYGTSASTRWYHLSFGNR